MNSPSWPTNEDQWAKAIENDVGLAPAAGRSEWARGSLDRQRIEEWIRERFDPRHGYHDDFVAALVRNLNGLLDWVYGDGSEPDWSRSDASQDRDRDP